MMTVMVTLNQGSKNVLAGFKRYRQLLKLDSNYLIPNSRILAKIKVMVIAIMATCCNLSHVQFHLIIDLNKMLDLFLEILY